MKAIGLLKDDTDLDDMIQRSYKFFADVPESCQINGENFTTLNKE